MQVQINIFYKSWIKHKLTPGKVHQAGEAAVHTGRESKVHPENKRKSLKDSQECENYSLASSLLSILSWQPFSFKTGGKYPFPPNLVHFCHNLLLTPQ
jgi:hypothetical protein